ALCFFSSRRRHTRSTRDWSSDVCSSDLSFIRKRRVVESVDGRLGETILSRIRERLPARGLLAHRENGCAEGAALVPILSVRILRSEERRVGKECSAQYRRAAWKNRDTEW